VPEAQRAAIEHELDRTEERPTLVYLIPSQRVLRRPITLPLAAEENLRQVLTFEMDRQTPFRADQVYFDHRIIRRDIVSKQLYVDVAIVPRQVADAELAALAPTGLAPDVLDAADGDVGRLGFNLLPPEARASRPNVWLRIDLALALAVLGLLVLAMVQSLKNREAALEALRAETQQMSREAKAVALSRTELTDAIAGANFLVEKKKSRPPVVDILLDVTRRLPDDTWLQRFSVNADQVQLQGQAREASALIATLQPSPVLKSPALQGAITPDARTGKEQFLIAATAQVPKPGTKPATPAAATPATTTPPATPPATTPAPATTPNAAPAEKTDASPSQR
jgi:general secretion pathway protein L